MMSRSNSRLQITIVMNLAVQSVSDMEMNIVSAERVEEFSESDSEVHKKLSFKHFICAEKWRHYYSWLD
ncbi:hypothetical protein ScPMuIL_002327, partial [Solemya velum]